MKIKLNKRDWTTLTTYNILRWKEELEGVVEFCNKSSGQVLVGKIISSDCEAFGDKYLHSISWVSI